MSKQVEADCNDKSEHDWKALQASLYRYCLVLTGSEWDAEDLSQTAWEKAIERLKKKGHDNPEAFLLRIAKNSWIDSCRRKAAYKELLNGMPCEYRGQRNEKFDLERALGALMNQLSPLQRTVFVLREALGYSIAETAGWLDTTEGAVKAALHRARRSLGAVREDMERDHTGPLLDPDEQRELQMAVDALQEGRMQELVTFLCDGYLWQAPVYAVGRFQSVMTRTGGCDGNSFLSMRMSA